LHCSGQESGSGQGGGRVSMSWKSASSTGGVWSYRGECHELHWGQTLSLTPSLYCAKHNRQKGWHRPITCHNTEQSHCTWI